MRFRSRCQLDVDFRQEVCPAVKAERGAAAGVEMGEGLGATDTARAQGPAPTAPPGPPGSVCAGEGPPSSTAQGLHLSGGNCTSTPLRCFSATSKGELKGTLTPLHPGKAWGGQSLQGNASQCLGGGARGRQEPWPTRPPAWARPFAPTDSRPEAPACLPPLPAGPALPPPQGLRFQVLLWGLAAHEGPHGGRSPRRGGADSPPSLRTEPGSGTLSAPSAEDCVWDARGSGSV